MFDQTKQGRTQGEFPLILKAPILTIESPDETSFRSGRTPTTLARDVKSTSQFISICQHFFRHGILTHGLSQDMCGSGQESKANT